MLKQSFLILPLLIAGGVVLTGAWKNSSASVPRSTQTPFVPQPFDLEAKEIDAKQLLDRAILELSPDRVKWLNTRIRQSMTANDSAFIAEGLLQRGPNGCARLELQIQTGGVQSRLLVVSDGELLAEERRIHDAAPKIDCHRLPLESDDSQAADRAACEAFLIRKGCGGPLPLLRDLRAGLRNLQHRTGLLEKFPVVEIQGDLKDVDMPLLAETTLPVGRARLYLDAKTLWPRCIELWGRDANGAPCRLAQMEFLDPQINQELPLMECVRLFSYQPEDRTKEPHAK